MNWVKTSADTCDYDFDAILFRVDDHTDSKTLSVINLVPMPSPSGTYFDSLVESLNLELII